MAPLPALTRPVNAGYVSWLELAWSAMTSRCHHLGTGVAVRLMGLQGTQAWWGITLDGRWLRGNNGALTIFDSVPAANRFLMLLKVDQFNISEGTGCEPFAATQTQEVYTLGGRSRRTHGGKAGNGAGTAGLQCLQLSQRRLVMGQLSGRASGYATPP